MSENEFLFIYLPFFTQKIKDLESQLGDIMAHLDAMSTIENNPELQGGGLAIGERKRGGVGGRRRKR